MLGLLADADVQGHFDVLMRICQRPGWREYWESTRPEVHRFNTLGLARDIKDRELWVFCQEHGILLITGNRNQEGPESLETTLRERTNVDSLPVLTIGEPARIRRDLEYAERVVGKLFEVLEDVDRFRGTGRVYMP